MNEPDEPARDYGAHEPWPPGYLTVTEAAGVLSRRPPAVLRLIHTGQLKSIRLGRSYRIREAELLRFLAGTMPRKETVSAAECARILHCPESTIHALVKNGHLASDSRGSSGSCRVAVSEFRRFLRQAEQRTTRSPGHSPPSR